MKDRAVLIVDDEPEIIELIRFFLKDEGFRVVTADNGVSARKVLAAENIGLIISDIRMPQEDGFQLLRYVKKQYPLIPFIFISAFTDMNIDEALRLGAQGFIRKPWEEGDLVLTVRRFWNQILSESRDELQNAPVRRADEEE